MTHVDNIKMFLSAVGLVMLMCIETPVTLLAQSADIKFERISYEQDLSFGIVQCIVQDRKGFLWIGTLDGLNCYDGYSFKVYRLDPNNPTSLSQNFVMSIYEDKSGTLWIGTYSGGLNKFDRSSNSFTHFKNDPNSPNSLSNNRVLSIYENKAGTLWIGTVGGLNRFDRSTNSFTHFKNDPNNPKSLSSNDVVSIYEDRSGTLWIGTRGGGLNKLDRSTNSFIHFKNDSHNPKSLSDNNAFSIYEDRSGTLWIGTGGGLNKLDRSTDSFTHFKNDPNNLNSLSTDDVISIYEDKSGTLWIGTDGGGLNKFDRSNGSFVCYIERDGLPSNAIFGILEDSRGNLWLSTHNGISRFNPRTVEFKNFDVTDGLQSNVFSYAAYKNSKGEMFFGGINGFNIFHPDSIGDNQYVPPIVISNFKIFNQLKHEGVIENDEMELSYKENFFSFEFAGLDFTNPSKNQYAYKMEGFDKDWIYTGSQRFASYTNLDPGEYIFRVKGSNNDGVWNENGASVKIIILPPFWKTWWFRSLVILAIGGVVVFVYNYRDRKLLEVERIRLRMASDLHDSVGSDLGSIALMSQRLQKRLEISDDARKDLAEITRASFTTAETLSDIVWFINPEHDSLDQMLLRMRDILGKTLNGIEYTFSLGDRRSQRGLNLESRRNLFLMYKEIVHNVVKHAQATKVDIRIEQKDELFRMSVTDNGKGFDATTENKGMGLKNLQKRAEAIGAQLELKTTPGSGTSVTVSVRIT